jgi:hypothetical protein
MLYNFFFKFFSKTIRFFLSKYPDCLLGQPPYNLAGAGVYLLGKTWLERKDDLLSVSSVEFKKDQEPCAYCPYTPL